MTRAVSPDGGWIRWRLGGAELRLELVFDPLGTRVWAQASPGVDDADVSAVVAGAGVGVVLRQRGFTCLHAGVLDIGGRGFLLLGTSGAGKSTTALALARAGATVVADDVAVLEPEADGFRARFGLPQVRLRPDPVAALDVPQGELASVFGSGEGRPAKQYLTLERPVGTAPPVLAGVFVLGIRAEARAPVALQRVDGGAALKELLGNRYVPFVLDRVGHARDFDVLARLAQHVPVWSVARSEGVDTVSEVAAAIEGQARAVD